MATRGREFPNSKRAGRNASEPMSSLVNKVEEPTLWSEGEGRWMDAGTTEVASIDSRGSRVGMYSKIDCPVLETRLWGWGGHRPLRIRQRNRSGPGWESEGFIVPFESAGQHNPGRGKGPCSRTRRDEDRGIAQWLATPDTIRTLQRLLYAQAKHENADVWHSRVGCLSTHQFW